MRLIECQGFGPGEKQSESFRVAIVGGGPGGLFSAWHLEHKAADACKITIFEADERPGGKLFTGSFAGAGPYEAGVAEIYDYSALGPDPLRELIEKDLGLKIKHIEGGPCVVDGLIIQNVDELGSYFGEAAQRDAAAFRARCAELYSPQHYYQSLCERDQTHPWTNLSGETVLRREIPNYMARRYIRAMCHSDVAAAPHLTNGVNLLKNVLMDVDGYMNIFAVVEGNGQIASRLVEELTSELRLGSPVRSIEKLYDGTYRLEAGCNGGAETVIADYVILALPLTALSIIKWRSEEFQRAMARHFSYFDRPAHYVRATLLFQRPFWREHLNTAWWMMDAFDGCCVYDEGARLDLGPWGALGFLIAGNAALGLANLSDEQIERLCLDALPPALAHGRELIVDRRVHRWLASVNAIPGGHPVRSRYQNHRPDPEQLPGVYIVGDYMFDATINGALDSADAATDMLLADILERRQSLHRRRQATVTTQAGTPASFAVALELLFASANIPDLMRAAWGVGPNAKVLLLGSASGKYVDELRELGYDAYGFEWRPSAYAGTARAFESFNRLGGLPRLPFPDDHFDVVLDAALCCLPRGDAPAVLRELRRITKSGLLFGSRTTDLSIDLIDRHSLLEGMQTLASRWDWSEMLFGAGFVHTLMDPARMHDTWTSVQASGAGPGRWYEDAEGLLYCVYSVAPLDWEEIQKDEKLRAIDEHDDLRVTVDETK